MEIFYVLGSYPTLLENMVAKVYEANAPLAEVDSIIIYEKDITGTPTVGAGHQVNQNVTFTGLDLVPHILRLFTASGTQLQEFNVLPTENVVTVFDPIYCKVGDGGATSPDEGDSSWVVPDLNGVVTADIEFHRNGLLQYPGYHYTENPSGGVDLLISGDLFKGEEELYIKRKPQVISTYVNDSVVGKQWGATTGNSNMFVDVVNTSVNHAVTHLRKLIRLSGNSGKYYFQSGDQIPIGYPFRFSNQVAGTSTIYFQNASLIKAGGDVTEFSLAVGQIAEFVYDGTKWNLTQNSIQSAPGYTIQGPYISAEFTVNAADELFTITIPNQGTTDYLVCPIPEGQNADWNSDNDIGWDIHGPSKTATQFKIAVRRFAGAGVKLKIRYFIMKSA